MFPPAQPGPGGLSAAPQVPTPWDVKAMGSVPVVTGSPLGLPGEHRLPSPPGFRQRRGDPVKARSS